MGIWRHRTSPEAPPSAPVTSTADLELWHDTYDQALLDGDILDPDLYSKAVAAADEATKPRPMTVAEANVQAQLALQRRPVKDIGSNWRSYTDMLKQLHYPPPMGSISAADGYVTLRSRDGKYGAKLTTEEWIRQGRPSYEGSIPGKIQARNDSMAIPQWITTSPDTNPSGLPR